MSNKILTKSEFILDYEAMPDDKRINSFLRTLCVAASGGQTNTTEVLAAFKEMQRSGPPPAEVAWQVHVLCDRALKIYVQMMYPAGQKPDLTVVKSPIITF